jgi:hypothetical protein
MALAMIYPEPEKGGRGRKKERVEETTTFSEKRLQQARAVLRHSRALADEVLKGATPFDKALEQIKSEQQRSLGTEARLARLRAEAPDFADLVDDERMTVAEACAANEKRQQEREYRRKEAREAAAGLWRDISVRLGVIYRGDEFGEVYALPDDDQELSELVMKQLAALRMRRPG